MVWPVRKEKFLLNCRFVGITIDASRSAVNSFDVGRADCETFTEVANTVAVLSSAILFVTTRTECLFACDTRT